MVVGRGTEGGGDRPSTVCNGWRQDVSVCHLAGLGDDSNHLQFGGTGGSTSFQAFVSSLSSAAERTVFYSQLTFPSRLLDTEERLFASR